MGESVAVYGAEIFKIEGLEQHAGGYESLKGLFGALGDLVDIIADFGQ